MFKKNTKFLLIFLILAFLVGIYFNTSETKADLTSDLVIEYLFPVGDLGDVIGVKVINNTKRLSPLAWYQANVPNPGQPSYLTMDGYYAVKDGRTVYAGVADVINPDTSPEVYPRIYLISHNDGARPETINIYEQLLANWRFNINIVDETLKAQLRRDLLRFYDLGEMKSALENYYDRYNRYPILEAGSYIIGRSSSQWPSWQGTLSQALGQSLPIDPINQFNGPCAGCPNDPLEADYQCAQSCYNSNIFTFEHPVGSHIYQYYGPEDLTCAGNFYNLTANLEYKPSADPVVWFGQTLDDKVTLNQTDTEVNYNYFYTSLEAPICGNNELECGELCDTNLNIRDNTICDSACLDWVCENLWGNCDADWGNGCEIDLSPDPVNCGACGNICQGPDNSRTSCIIGTCDWDCRPGYREWNNECELSLCESPYGIINTVDKRACSITNGTGEQSRTCKDVHPPTWDEWGICLVVSCDNDYRQVGNQCVTATPNTPTLGEVVADSYTIMDISWIDQSDNEDRFELQRSSDGGSTWVVATANVSANTTTYTDTGLTAGTTYAYRVRAMNQAGTSTWSNSLSAALRVYLCAPSSTQTQSCFIANGSSTQTRVCSLGGSSWGSWSTCNLTSCDNDYRQVGNQCVAAIPNTPTLGEVVADSYTIMDISWIDQSDNEDRFELQRSSDGGSTWVVATANVSANTTSYTDTGLTAGTTYAYRVRAMNQAGTSTWSNSLSAVLRAYLCAPSSTQNQSCLIANGSGTQTRVCSANGSSWGSWSTCNLISCDPGYREYNNMCESELQVLQFPNTPTLGEVVADSYTIMDISWIDQSDNEDRFELQRSSDGGSTWVVATANVSANTTSYTDTGLTAGTTYAYRVRAMNQAGTSTWSNSLSATLPEEVINVLNTPINFTAITSSATVIRLIWNDVSNEDRYEIAYSYSGSAATITVSANATSYNHTSLQPNEIYTYKIKACNIDGCSNWSSSVSALTATTPPPPPPPAIPASLSVTSTIWNQINLSWQDSGNETSYKLERKDGSSSAPWVQIVSLASNVTSYSDTAVSPETNYYYRIRACNNNGCSDYSNTVSTTTLSALPNAPSNLLATTQSSSEIRLSWRDNADNETGFKIERKKFNTSWSQIIRISANATSYTDIELSPLTIYHYRLRAYNEYGDSNYSNEFMNETEAEVINFWCKYFGICG